MLPVDYELWRVYSAEREREAANLRRIAARAQPGDRPEASTLRALLVTVLPRITWARLRLSPSRVASSQ